jgi:HK97 family phage portal protein
MKLAFWRTKAAGPSRPVVPVWAQPISPGTAGYDAQVRAAFLGNPVGSRAIRLVAEGAGGAPLASNPAAHPALRLLASAGFGASGPGLIEVLAGHMLLHGNAFVDVALGSDGLPAALFALRPERLAPVLGSDGWVTAWDYRVGGAVTRYPAEVAGGGPGLLHMRSFHPLDDHWGAGCLAAAAGAVDMHNAASRWNRALLDNAARPSGALTYQSGDGVPLSTEQFERLQDQMNQAFAGSGNAGRPMLLEGGLNWQAMSLSPAEMDFAGMREAAAREIALALGVPPLLMGLKGDSTYANYREANVALWRQTLLPLLGRILAALSAHLGWWWPGLQISVDRDQVPELAEAREKLWAQVGGADFLSTDEKRRILGLEEQP